MKTKTNKKASAKKVAPAKKATAKKVAPKKTAVKKATAKKAVSTKKPVTKKATVSNKELDKMLKTIEKAQKKKESSVVVYTTSSVDHPNASSGGFGFQDLKPNLQEAYKKILCQFNLRTNMVNASEKKVEWIVDL